MGRKKKETEEPQQVEEAEAKAEETEETEEISEVDLDELKASVVQGRIFKEGTVLKMGDTEVTLQAPAVFIYKGHKSEQQFVGMLMNSHPDNMAVNLASLENRYDHNGALIED